MATIKEVPAKAGRFERIGAHTHVKGLGLDEALKAIKVRDGMVGQEKAREAAGLIVRMIKEGKLSGKSIILAGPCPPYRLSMPSRKVESSQLRAEPKCWQSLQ